MQDVFTDYQSPRFRRIFGRILLWIGLIIVVLILWSIASNYEKRKEAGRPPITPASVVSLAGPLGMVLIGLWIGHGQTRIDLGRGTIVNRPLGLPFPAKVSSLGRVYRLYVGYYRAPSRISTPSTEPRIGSPGVPLWFVRMDGEQFKVMLIRQRSYEEAAEFALSLSKRTGIKVESQERPKDG